MYVLDEDQKMERESHLEIYSPPHVTKNFWRRAAHIHSLVYQHKEMIDAHIIGNKLITKSLDDLINSAINDIPLIARARLPSLATYITCWLKEKKSAHITDPKGARKSHMAGEHIHHQCGRVKITFTLRDGDLGQGVPNRARALAAVELNGRAISLALFCQESALLPPIHKQNVDDTCHTGWVPAAIWNRLLGAEMTLILISEQTRL